MLNVLGEGRKKKSRSLQSSEIQQIADDPRTTIVVPVKESDLTTNNIHKEDTTMSDTNINEAEVEVEVDETEETSAVTETVVTPNGKEKEKKVNPLSKEGLGLDEKDTRKVIVFPLIASHEVSQGLQIIATEKGFGANSKKYLAELMAERFADDIVVWQKAYDDKPDTVSSTVKTPEEAKEKASKNLRSSLKVMASMGMGVDELRALLDGLNDSDTTEE